jgi:hypothetical protein
MGLDGESQVFLTQEDHEDDEIKLFQTKSGESLTLNKAMTLLFMKSINNTS